MKKFFIVFSIFSLFILASCSKHNEEDIFPADTGSDTSDTGTSDNDTTDTGDTNTDTADTGTDTADTGDISADTDIDTDTDTGTDTGTTQEDTDEDADTTAPDEETSDSDSFITDPDEDETTPEDDSDNDSSDSDTTDNDLTDSDDSDADDADSAESGDEDADSDTDDSDSAESGDEDADSDADDSDSAESGDEDADSDTDDADSAESSDEDTDADTGSGEEGLHECSVNPATPCKSGNLIWSSRSADTTDLDTAKSKCAKHKEGTFTSGWRLPTINELRTVIRNCTTTEPGGNCRVTNECPYLEHESLICYTNQSCKKVFGDICSTSVEHSPFGEKGKLWSATTIGYDPTQAWYVGFKNGEIGYSATNNNYEIYYRCVHNIE